MNPNMKGQDLFRGQRTIDPGKLDEMAAALDSETAAVTATLVPFFGPTIPGETTFVDLLEMDKQRVLLGGLSFEWSRPFRAGEVVDVRLFVEDMYSKGTMQFAIVSTEFCDAAGETIQLQKATFIERGAE